VARLVALPAVHVEAFWCQYSADRKLDDPAKAANVVIPNDAPPTGRALLLLRKRRNQQIEDKAKSSPPRVISPKTRRIIPHPRTWKLHLRELQSGNWRLSTNYAWKPV